MFWGPQERISGLSVYLYERGRPGDTAGLPACSSTWGLWYITDPRSWQTSSREYPSTWHEHHLLIHSQEALDLNYMLDHVNLAAVQRFYPTTPEDTFFSYEHGPFSNIDYASKQHE